MNVIVLTGRMVFNPEVKVGQSGKVFTRFSIAVDRTFKKGEVDFINCVAFGKTAELIGEYLRKGDKAGFQGALQTNRYEKDGEKRTSYDVAVNQIEFLNNKGEHEGAVASDNAPVAEPTADTEDSDEFPFK